MRIGYIDTSFLLSIVFQDDNYEQSAATWNSLEVMYSSLLTEIESRINVYKYYILSKKNRRLYSEKEKELAGLLASINRKVIDEDISLEIKNIDKLKRPRSSDSIHLATAHIINKLNEDRILLCSYDKDMMKTGNVLGMEVMEQAI